MEGIRRLDEAARIREKIASLDVVFARVPGVSPDFHDLDMSEAEIAIYNKIDGRLNVRELTGRSDLTEFEVTRILFQLLLARLIEPVAEDKQLRPVFLDVEDSPELLKVISTYNDMFGRLFEALEKTVGEDQAREIFMTILQNARPLRREHAHREHLRAAVREAQDGARRGTEHVAVRATVRGLATPRLGREGGRVPVHLGSEGEFGEGDGVMASLAAFARRTEEKRQRRKEKREEHRRRFLFSLFSFAFSLLPFVVRDKRENTSA
jgi:hypothetical protein